MASSNGQQGRVEQPEDPNDLPTHFGKPSIEAIMNSVPPSWDGSNTLPSTLEIINHRNMLLQAFYPGLDLIPVSEDAVVLAQRAIPVLDQRYRVTISVIQPVPGQALAYQQTAYEPPTSTSTTTSGSSYRGSAPSNHGSRNQPR